MANKRGISSVITVSLIILGTIIGAALLWAFVNRSIQRGGDVVDPDCLTIDLELAECKAYGECNYGSGLSGYEADMLIKRNVGSGNISGLRFIFEDLYGIKKTYDRDLNPLTLNELESARFTQPYRIPVQGSPNIARVAALLGEKKDVCPIASQSKKCSIELLPPPFGNRPNNPQLRSYCCQFPVNLSECYPSSDPLGILNLTTGALLSGRQLPGFNKTVCCSSSP